MLAICDHPRSKMTSTRSPQFPTTHESHRQQATSFLDELPTASRTPRRAPIPALTGVRVVLAAWIIGHHLIRWLATDTPLVADHYGVLRQGQAATSGFFVLGGFGLAWAYGERLAIAPTLEGWGRYLRRRWAAVWPLGMLGAVLTIPFELRENIMEGGELATAFVANALLVQSWLPMGGGQHGISLRFDAPTWTLSTLLFFYAVFPVVALVLHRRVHSRRALALCGVVPWLLLVASTIAIGREPLGFWFVHVHPFARGVDLLVGTVIGTWLVRHGRPSARAGWVLQPLAAVAVGGSALAAVALDAPRWMTFGAWYIPCMALLAVALAAEGGPLVRLFAWRRLERPGRVAFAMLMLHVPFISTGWQLGLVRPDRPVTVAVVVVGCLAISWLVHLRVERPLVRRLAGGAPSDAGIRSAR